MENYLISVLLFFLIMGLVYKHAYNRGYQDSFKQHYK